MCLWTEQYRLNRWWGEARTFINNGSLANPSWQFFDVNRWEAGNVAPNMLCFHKQETPITIGKYDGNSCIIISPHLDQF